MAAPPVPPFPLPPPSGDDLLVVAGLVGALALLAAREVVAGALRKAGKELWCRLKRRGAR